MFKTRLISSIVLVVLALVVILTGGYLLAAVLLFLSLTAYRELMKACGLTEKGKPSGLEIIGYTGIVAYYLVMVFTKQEEEMLLLVLIMILIAFMFLYVLTFPKFHADQNGAPSRYFIITGNHISFPASSLLSFFIISSASLTLSTER